MKHITFARFPDRKRAAEGLRCVREHVTGSPEIVLHWGSSDAASFEQVVQHSGDFAETDMRHAVVVGTTSGLGTGAVFGAILAAIDIFPGTVMQGVGFGALMGVLVGLLMMSIFGAGLMDRRLQKLTRGLRAGEVVITVHSEDRDTCDLVNRTLEQSGAQVAEKSVA